jgi:flagellin
MGLTIMNNVASLTAQNNLSKTNSKLGMSLEKLSTGLKVNRGADGPAALVISERQRAQIAGLKTAIDNTNKAVSLVQTGEGALNELNTLLTKARSLALDSANSGVNDANAFAANQSELSNILTTVDNIVNTTEFNGKKLLNGSASPGAVGTSLAGISGNVKAGTTPTSGDYSYTISTAAQKARVAGSGGFTATTSGTTSTVGVTGSFDITYPTSSGTLTATINLQDTDTVDAAITKINSALSGASITDLKATLNGNQLQIENTKYGSAGNFTVVDGGAGSVSRAIGLTSTADVTTTNGVDVAGTVSFGGVAQTVTGTGNTLEVTGASDAGLGLQITAGDSTTAFTSKTVTTASTATVGTGLVFQIGANAGQTATINFDKANTTAIGKGQDATMTSLNLADVSSATNAQTSLKVIDQAISDITNLRSKLGAFQANTLESTANNLQTTLENVTSAESVIRDTNFASEIANYTKLQTQMQAGATVLGNANQMTSLVAGLLRG